jgi:hypothetical protein
VTPAAVTPAARSRPRTAAPRPAKATAHPRPVRARVAPAAPRRVSGPKRQVRARPTRPSSVSLSGRAAEFVRGLPDHPLLDRLVRGRAWIPVLGVMLAGIIAMQVEVLKLNASMGRSITLASSLQTRNEQLRTSVSSLSDAHRIERLAARMGMVMPGPTSVDFLHGRGSAARAAASIHAPDSSMFDSALQASALQAAAATTPAPATSTLSSTTATTPTVSTPTVSSTTASTSTSTVSSGVVGPGTTGVTAGAGATGATVTTPSATSATSNSGGAAPSG